MVAVTLALCLGGCGKSERQKQAEREADDARWEASLAAAEDERQKTEQALLKAELSRLAAHDQKPANPANPAIRPSGWAVNGPGVTKQNMEDAEKEVRKSIALAHLPQFKESLQYSVIHSVPHPEKAVIRNAHMNKTHDALCGEIDFEYWDDKDKLVRSGFRSFVANTSRYRNSAYDPEPGSGVATNTAINIDTQSRARDFRELSAKIDCYPDLAY
jgi:hypothetical protein